MVPPATLPSRKPGAVPVVGAVALGVLSLQTSRGAPPTLHDALCDILDSTSGSSSSLTVPPAAPPTRKQGSGTCGCGWSSDSLRSGTYSMCRLQIQGSKQRQGAFWVCTLGAHITSDTVWNCRLRSRPALHLRQRGVPGAAAAVACPAQQQQ